MSAAGDDDRVESVSHGHAFNGMYAPAETVSLKQLVIESFLFTEDGFFGGFELRDLDLGILYPIASESLEG